MKKVILILVPIILVLGILVIYPIFEHRESKTEIPIPKEDVAKSSEQSLELLKEDMLSKLEKQEFIIEAETLEDNETIIAFGKAFVNLYNGAVQKQKKVSFEKYIDNKNLRDFTDKILDLTQKQDLQGGNFVNYGLDNEYREANLEHVGDGNCYLELLFEYAGSGMRAQLLITEENNSLKLVDLYFGTKDGVDTFAIGHPATRKVNNPNLWNDEEWVKNAFDKLEEFEKEHIRTN